MPATHTLHPDCTRLGAFAPRRALWAGICVRRPTQFRAALPCGAGELRPLLPPLPRDSCHMHSPCRGAGCAARSRAAPAALHLCSPRHDDECFFL